MSSELAAATDGRMRTELRAALQAGLPHETAVFLLTRMVAEFDRPLVHVMGHLIAAYELRAGESPDPPSTSDFKKLLQDLLASESPELERPQK